MDQRFGSVRGPQCVEDDLVHFSIGVSPFLYKGVSTGVLFIGVFDHFHRFLLVFHRGFTVLHFSIGVSKDI